MYPRFLKIVFPLFEVLLLNGESGLHETFLGAIDNFNEVDSRMVEFDLDVGVFL
jgi:hypothetical protein